MKKEKKRIDTVNYDKKINDSLPSKIWSGAVDNIILLFFYIQEGAIFAA